MIYTSHPDLNEEVHLWLESMTQAAIEGGDGAHLPDESALCGHEFDGQSLTPAKDTWADSLEELLNTTGVCEECKTRAAVYYDVVDEAALWAKSNVRGRCNSCDVDHAVEILGVKSNGLVKRRLWCPLCDHETEDEVRIPEEVEYGTH